MFNKIDWGGLISNMNNQYVGVRLQSRRKGRNWVFPQNTKNYDFRVVREIIHQ